MTRRPKTHSGRRHGPGSQQLLTSGNGVMGLDWIHLRIRPRSPLVGAQYRRLTMPSPPQLIGCSHTNRQLATIHIREDCWVPDLGASVTRQTMDEWAPDGGRAINLWLLSPFYWWPSSYNGIKVRSTPWTIVFVANRSRGMWPMLLITYSMRRPLTGDERSLYLRANEWVRDGWGWPMEAAAAIRGADGADERRGK